MSHPLYSLNADLKRLRDDGFIVRIKDNDKFLVVDVPYVNVQRKVAWGHLISPLELQGDITCNPVPNHQVYFDGDHPCDANGVKIRMGGSELMPVQDVIGFKARFHFSRKPAAGYQDYYEKMTTYHALLAGPAMAVDPTIVARPLQAAGDDDPESIFEYPDTASGRNGTAALADLFRQEVVAHIGVGGTGAYILDKVVKTPVKEIRLFDGDHFLNHNAFRAPGAASIEELRDAPKKVDYFYNIYRRMHRNIKPFPEKITAANVHLLDGVTFAFICMGDGKDKQAVFDKLEAIGASFIDVGMGLELEEGSLGGILRVTLSTPDNREEARKQATFTGLDDEAVYKSNIQVADLNSLNADLAVIRWKRLRGFFRDLLNELHCSYTTDGNILCNKKKT